MKNKFLGGIAVLAVAAVAAWNVNFNLQKNDLSNVSLANVEALAQSETGNGTTSGTCGWSSGAYRECNISKWEAQTLQQAYGGYWCCDSCSNTSYCG